MAEKVDPGLIQRYLSLVGDIIHDKIVALNGGTETAYDGIVKISPTGASFDAQTSAKIRHIEHQLMSLQPVSTAESAMELFANGRDDDPESINFKYSIHNNIMLELADGFYYFNIDEVNNSKDAAHRFLIHKLELKNVAKDSFTAKSNYVVTFDIAFKYFDDLLGEYVTIRKVGEETTTRKIPLMFILYKGFNPAGLQLDIYDQQLRDSNGIYLNQFLSLRDKDKFKSTISDLDSQIHRTHHLTFYKHEFDVFKSQDPILVDYENHLKISYVSYEADITAKFGKSANTPTSLENLYSLLGEQRLNDSVSKVKQISDELLKATTQKGCIDLYNKTTGAQKDKLTKFKNTKVEDVNVEIQRLAEIISQIKQDIDRDLILTILSRCRVYNFPVKQTALGITKDAEDTEKLITGILLTTFGVGIAIGSAFATGGLSIVAGLITGASVALPGVGSLKEYFKTTYSAKTPAAAEARAVASGVNITLADSASVKRTNLLDTQLEEARKEAESIRNSLSSPAAPEEYKNNGRYQQLLNIIKRREEQIKEELDKADAVVATEEEGELGVKFILFGDLIKILTEISGERVAGTQKHITILSGGKLIPQDTNGLDNKYLNVCDIPIYLNSVWEFLNKQIIKKENRNFQYHSELFLRDAFDMLLKSALKDSDGMLDDQYKHYIPGNLHMNAGVHFAGVEYDRVQAPLRLDILNSEELSRYKGSLVKSKLIPSKGVTDKNILRKVYSLGTIEEARYFDYYENYKEWAIKNGNAYYSRNISSEVFQQYMLKEHFIPCVLIRYSANNETILRKKNLSFSRIDNPNLTVGNILDGKPIFRLPYQFSGEFKPYVSFFLDIGSLIFIAPPESRLEQYTNTFGFGGLYVIKESTMVYNFQRLSNGSPTLPNEESYLTLGGYLISHGDAVKPDGAISGPAQDLFKKCTDATIPTSVAPAANQP